MSKSVKNDHFFFSKPFFFKNDHFSKAKSVNAQKCYFLRECSHFQKKTQKSSDWHVNDAVVCVTIAKDNGLLMTLMAQRFGFKRDLAEFAKTDVEELGVVGRLLQPFVYGIYFCSLSKRLFVVDRRSLASSMLTSKEPPKYIFNIISPG